MNIYEYILLSNLIYTYQHDPCYSQKSQGNLVKALFDLHGEVLTGFKNSFKQQLPKVFNIFHFKLVHPCS